MTSIIRDIQKYSEWVSAHAGRLPAVHLRLFDCPCRSSSRPLPNMPPGGRFLHLLRRVVHADQSSQPGHMLLGHPHPGSSAKDCRVGRRNLHGMPHGRRSSASMINRNMAWGKAQDAANPHLPVAEAPLTTEMPTSLGGGEHLCPCSNRAMFNGRTSLDGNATAKTVGDWILFHPRA